jgi:hypothetical protein
MTHNRRPCPDDFVDMVAKLETANKLAQHYRCGHVAVIRWLDEKGLRANKVYTRGAMPPDDFADIAPKHSKAALCRFYGQGFDVINRWLSETGATHGGRPKGYTTAKRRPVPDDWATMCPRLSKTALRRYYTAAGETIDRWIAESGIQPLPTSDAHRQAGAKAQGGTSRMGRAHFVHVSDRVRSMYDDAANVLRKYGPVSRCDENGKYQQAGDYWRVGWNVITGDELLERANAKRSKAA